MSIRYSPIEATSSQTKVTYAVGDNMRVAMKRSLGITVLRLVAGKVPDDQGLITTTGQEHVRATS
jgi:hypothetical protein